MPSHAQLRMQGRDGAVPTIVARTTPCRGHADNHQRYRAQPAAAPLRSLAHSAAERQGLGSRLGHPSVSIERHGRRWVQFQGDRGEPDNCVRAALSPLRLGSDAKRV